MGFFFTEGLRLSVELVRVGVLEVGGVLSAGAAGTGALNAGRTGGRVGATGGGGAVGGGDAAGAFAMELNVAAAGLAGGAAGAGIKT